MGDFIKFSYLLNFFILYSIIRVNTLNQIDRYDLALELFKNNIFEIDIGLCIARKASNFQTDLLTNEEKIGHRLFGLFQFLENKWCIYNETGGDCNIDCQKFLDNNLDDDIDCLKKMYKLEGKSAWNEKVQNCFEKNLNQIDRYDLAIKLYQGGMKNIHIWLCVAGESSNFQLNLQRNCDKIGARNFGIFQFFENVWCVYGKKGGGCNMDCRQFIDDDVKDDIECAKIVYEKEGITAWTVDAGTCLQNITYLLDDCA